MMTKAFRVYAKPFKFVYVYLDKAFIAFWVNPQKLLLIILHTFVAITTIRVRTSCKTPEKKREREI